MLSTYLNIYFLDFFQKLLRKVTFLTTSIFAKFMARSLGLTTLLYYSKLLKQRSTFLLSSPTSGGNVFSKSAMHDSLCSYNLSMATRSLLLAVKVATCFYARVWGCCCCSCQTLSSIHPCISSIVDPLPLVTIFFCPRRSHLYVLNCVLNLHDFWHSLCSNELPSLNTGASSQAGLPKCYLFNSKGEITLDVGFFF